MSGVANGLQTFLTLSSVLTAIAGLLVGFGAGLVPGFSASNAAALVLGLTIPMSTVDAIIFMSGIYAGDTFSGSVPAILLNIPGTPGAAATAIDGYPMAKKGKASQAISLARVGSASGGVLATVVVIFVIEPLGHLALKFGSREMCLVVLLGLMVMATVIGKSLIRGLVSGLVGMLLAAVGLDPITAGERMTFGILPLADGIPLAAAVVGLFAVVGMLDLSRAREVDSLADSERAPANASRGLSAWLPRRRATQRQPLREVARSEWRDAAGGARLAARFPRTILESTFIGLLLGIVPGAGTSVSAFAGYARAKASTKTPELFGQGAAQGVVAAEAADTSETAGALVPTLTLGIPAGATSAVMLSALYLHGVTPGPALLQTDPGLGYAVLFALLLCCILILPFGIILAIPMRRVVRARPALLIPPILVLGMVGAFAVRNELFDMRLALIFGAVGLLMRMGDYPVNPLILGLVLGPLMESNLDHALLLGNDRFSYFFGSPTAIVLWVAVVGAVVYSVLRALIRNRRSRPVAVSPGAPTGTTAGTAAGAQPS